MNENHLALVLRSADYRDNDKMLTLLTADKGKISALARGIRKPGNSMFGTADLFCCTEFGFYLKNERYTATQAVLKNSFYNIRNNYDALLTASAISEICEAASTEEEENKRLFALLAGSFFALDLGKKPEEVFLFFSAKFLDIAGVRPDLKRCVVCGARAANKINIFKGGAVCEKCPGTLVEESLINDIDTVLHTPSKAIADTELKSAQKYAELMVRWTANEIGFIPKSLKIMADNFQNGQGDGH